MSKLLVSTTVNGDPQEFLCDPGASLLDAKLSGTYFPAALSAQEIRLSLETGTRLRYSND